MPDGTTMILVAEQPVPITGIVLAGGRSTRFGDASVNKATTALEGKTLLEQVTDAVATATNRPPVVAVQTEAQRVANQFGTSSVQLTPLAENDRFCIYI